MATTSGPIGQTARRLIRRPRFTIVAIITLAAAIGANAAVFGVLNCVLLRPLPYPDAERLVGGWQSAPGLDIKDLDMAPANYFIFREQSTSFEDVGMYNGGQFSITGTGEPEEVGG